MFSIFFENWLNYFNNRAKSTLLLKKIANPCWASGRKNKSPLYIGLIE